MSGTLPFETVFKRSLFHAQNTICEHKSGHSAIGPVRVVPKPQLHGVRGKAKFQVLADLAERLHGQMVEFQPAFDKALEDVVMIRPLIDDPIEDPIDHSERGTMRRLFEPARSKAALFERTPEDLSWSKASQEIQVALDYAYDR